MRRAMSFFKALLNVTCSTPTSPAIGVQSNSQAGVDETWGLRRIRKRRADGQGHHIVGLRIIDLDQELQGLSR